MMKHIWDILSFRTEKIYFRFFLCLMLCLFCYMPHSFAATCQDYEKESSVNKNLKDSELIKSDQQRVQKRNAVHDYCKQLAKKYSEDEIFWDDNPLTLWRNDDDINKYKQRFNQFLTQHPEEKEKFEQLAGESEAAGRAYDSTFKNYLETSPEAIKRAEERQDIKEGIASGKYIPCGEDNPKGCPSGKECYSKRTGYYEVGASVAMEKYECRESGGFGWRKAPLGSQGKSYSIETNVGVYGNTVYTDELGDTHVEENSLAGISVKGNRDNSVCKVAEMEKKYQSSCYSCIVVKTLLEKFINACTKVSDLCRRAAVQVLLVATLLWVAFWALKTISSVASLEPSSIVNTLLIQGFKILFAYVVIESGIEVFMIHVVSPILVAGADFGTAILANSQSHLSMTPSPDYTYSGVELLSADMLNKIMGFNESLDRVVSTNLVIGHALTCHSVNAGAWVNHSIMDFQIIIPNVWIWLCGAAIWFAGFMLVLAVSYYLLDISFKIGIAIMIFPLLMALWPFSITAGKVKTCIKTMLSSAAIFAFLAITTSYAMAMISVTLRDVPELFERVEKGDSKWISDTFDITGPYFILILFAYLYSIKLVRSTVDDYVNKFFGGGLMANASPMHSEMTRMTDIAKKATVGAGKAAVGAATGGAGKVLGAVAGATVGKAAKFVKDKFTKSDKEQGKNNKSPNAGTAVKQSGKAIKQSGKAVEQSGKAVEQAGKGVDKAGQGIAHGGKGIMTAGKGLSATGFGAIIGVPMMIAGAAVYAGGAAVQAGGKATVAAGKAVKASGKVMKKSGEMIEKAGRSMEKFGRKLKFGKDADKQDKPQDNQENSGQAE